MSYSPRWYQEEAVESIFKYYLAGKQGHPLIALPTGTGKSLVIGDFIRRAMQRYSGQRFLVATHVKELLQQNSEKLREVWPVAPYGIYSAGLHRNDKALPIIFGGIASIKNCIKDFGHRDIMMIDEAHLLSPDSASMYNRVISELLEINPYMKVIGLTATQYRLGQGLLTDGGLFTDTIYDMTSFENFNRLLAEGYISPIYPKRTAVQVNMADVSLAKGEFNQAQSEKVFDAVTQAACREMCEFAYNRQSWLVFASGIKHAEHVAQLLRNYGIKSVAVHSKMGKGKEGQSLRDKAIVDFKNGIIRCVVSYGMFTTGFDHPPIDFIGMLRATMSPGLWVQMLGRGTRPSPESGKQDCLCLDFAGNTARLGPINDPRIPRKKGVGSGDIPVKICEACGTYNHISARVCACCGAEFAIQCKLVKTAANDELIRSTEPVIQSYKVDRVSYNLHAGKKSGKETMRVSYICGLRMFQEWWDFEHKQPFVAHRARQFWRRRAGTEETPPSNVEAVKWASMSLAVPQTIDVHVNKQYPEIVGYHDFYRKK